MELIAGLWSELPSELLEQVLPFLTVPDLCRYRSACKRWNSLICVVSASTLLKVVEDAKRSSAGAICVLDV
jgi:hypothetical protein